jgi:hypothetical protein
VYDGITTNETYTSVGLYVGPSLSTPGAARVAVMPNSRCRILTTNNFRSGTDGGGLNVYPHIERRLKQLLFDQIATRVVDGVEVEPESEIPTATNQLQAGAQEKRSDVAEPSSTAVGADMTRGRGKRGRPCKENTRVAPVQEHVVPTQEPISEKLLDAHETSVGEEPTANQDAQVEIKEEKTSIVPFKLLNTSGERGGRRSYKAAGRRGLKVARGRSKSPEVVEGGSVDALNGRGADNISTAPTNEPTVNQADALPISEPSSVPTGAPTNISTSTSSGTPTNEQETPKRSARIRERKERCAEVGGVAHDTVEL